MKIGVIGGGTVGRAVARTYLEFVDEVRVYDLLPERSTHSKGDTVASDVIFVCVPEDQAEMSFSLLLPEERRANFVLKSTVPVGTTRRLREKYGLSNLVHSPEFLTERCAETDARIPAVNIIGHPGPDVPGLVSCLGDLHALYARRFPGTPVFVMKSDESETVKLALNSLFAEKVAAFNEVREFCDRRGLDWETVRAGILADGRITAHHTAVPGPDGERGFGGACLPKDLEAFALCMAEVGMIPQMAIAAQQANRTYRKGGK